MRVTANGGNTLHELARAMAASGRHSTAAALRKLAHAGYATLQQVDSTPDWILLAIRGIGVGRLGEVRRLSRPDWQPPSPQAIQAGVWFVTAVQFALCYWPVNILISLLRGSPPSKADIGPVEKRLALDVLSQAVRRARCYYSVDELIQALGPVGDNHDASACVVRDNSSDHDPRVEVLQDAVSEPPEPDLVSLPHSEEPLTKDSDRFAHPRHKRFEIVQAYRAARERGEVQNKDSWARSRYHISGKTLLCYEREFSESRHSG